MAHHNTDTGVSELLYASLLDSVRAIVWRAELPGFRTTFASKQAESILGYPPERWTSDPTWWIQQTHPEDRDWVIRFMSAAVRERRNHSFEFRMIAADGRVVWLREIVNVIIEGTEPRELVGVSIDITEQKEAERVREQFAGRVLAAQEEERRTIARELHDDIGQSVALLHMTLGDLQDRLGSPELVAKAQDVSDLVIRIESDLKRISQGLHPSVLEHLGVGTAIRRLCREFGDRHGATVECRIGDMPPDLDPIVISSLYRVCQECLRNIAKHTQAKMVTVDLSASPTEVSLSVHDNGMGFDVSATADVGLGLASMNERLRLLGGTLEVFSTLGDGTRVSATAPLSQDRSSEL